MHTGGPGKHETYKESWKTWDIQGVPKTMRHTWSPWKHDKYRESRKTWDTQGVPENMRHTDVFTSNESKNKMKVSKSYVFGTPCRSIEKEFLIGFPPDPSWKIDRQFISNNWTKFTIVYYIIYLKQSTAFLQSICKKGKQPQI